MIPTPQQAYELLQEYNQGEFHLKHGRIVGDVMRWFAQELGYGEEADFWQAVGILHDLDFERWPDLHGVVPAPAPLRQPRPAADGPDAARDGERTAGPDLLLLLRQELAELRIHSG